MADSDVIYQAKLHWVVFLWPVVLACIAMLIGIKFYLLKEVALFLVLFSILWAVMMWIKYHFSSVTIKKKQVILCTGMLTRQTIDIPITKIETIDITQSILGGILQYGTLMVIGTGGTRHLISCLDKPLTCRRYIEQLMHEE